MSDIPSGNEMGLAGQNKQFHDFRSYCFYTRRTYPNNFVHCIRIKVPLVPHHGHVHISIPLYPISSHQDSIESH